MDALYPVAAVAATRPFSAAPRKPHKYTGVTFSKTQVLYRRLRTHAATFLNFLWLHMNKQGTYYVVEG